VFDRFGVPAVPHKADFIEPSFAFTVHFPFLSTSALNGHPMAKMDPAFDVESGHVAMTFAGFERLESLKCLFPPLINVDSIQTQSDRVVPSASYRGCLGCNAERRPTGRADSHSPCDHGERRNAPHAL
jgi:hypothetical protein